MSETSKKITADQAPEGAKRKLVGTIVEYISIVNAGANMREFIAKAEAPPDVEGMVRFEKQVRVTKLDEERKRVMGVVYTPDETDAHGDYMDKATVEAMAADFLRGGRTNNVDRNHNFIPGEGYVMESYLIKEGGDSEFPGEKPGTWVVTIQVTSETTWNKIKDGDLKGLSLAGYATAEDVEVVEEEGTTEVKTLELPWDEEGAIRRLEMRATSSEGIDFGLYSEGFASISPSEHLDSIKAYQYPHHDVVKDELVVNPRGVRDATKKVFNDLGEGRLTAGQADEALTHLGLHLTESGESILDVDPGELAPKSLGTFLEKLTLPFVKLPKGITKAEVLSNLEEQARRKELQEIVKAAGTEYSFEASLKNLMAFVLSYTDLIYLLWYVVDNIMYSRELTLTEKQTALTTSVTAFLNAMQASLVQAYSLTLSVDGGNSKLFEVTLAMLEKEGKVTLTKEELEEKLAAARKEAAEEALKKIEKTTDVTPVVLPTEGGNPNEAVTKEISGLNEKLGVLTTTVEKLAELVTSVVDRVKTVEEARGITKKGDPDNRRHADEVPYETVGVGKSLRENLIKGRN